MQKGKNAYSTLDSQAVSDPSTKRARRCLTWLIGREAVFSTWYGRKRESSPCTLATIPVKKRAPNTTPNHTHPPSCDPTDPDIHSTPSYTSHSLSIYPQPGLITQLSLFKHASSEYEQNQVNHRFHILSMNPRNTLIRVYNHPEASLTPVHSPFREGTFHSISTSHPFQRCPTRSKLYKNLWKDGNMHWESLGEHENTR